MSADYFEMRERALLGDAYDTLYAAPSELCRGLTVNLLRCTPAEFARIAPAQYALTPSPFCKEAFLLQDETARPGLSVYHHAGVYYMQEPSAASAAPLLDVQPGDCVLDVCAAPGGKTSQLAAAMHGQGILVANEYVAARAAALRGNLERMGVANALVLHTDTARLAAAFPRYFNKVLADVPCSGEGMFRKEPEALRQHSEALVRQCAALGAQVLENAAACVAPGGLLAYSTYTFAPEEDEAQIGAFLQRHPDFTLRPLSLEAGSPGEAARMGGFAYPVARTRRLYPCHGGEGHFLALLQREGAVTEPPVQKYLQGKPPLLESAQFLAEYFPHLEAGFDLSVRIEAQGRLSMLSANEMLYLLPRACIHTINVGVQTGGVVKGRFVPAHHLFMVYGAQCANIERLTADDPCTAAWLRGEEIAAQTAQQGYAAVLCDGFPLGFGKQSGGRLKNHYPKGLRNLK